MDKYLGETIPKLGFGLMRLPMKDDQIDIEATKEMVDVFIENGFNYFDTAYVYNDGESEKAAKEALVKRYPREKYKLATKLPAWVAKTEKEAKQMFETSLERCGVEFFDFFLLHNLGDERTEMFERFKIWEFLAQKKQQGFIKHLGFSIHDKANVLDEILTEHPEMEFVQLQVNYADWEHPLIETRKCLEVAKKHGKPVIVMEPIRGGLLANPPKEIKELFKSEDPDASCASWAVRFAASQDNIITVLSGMSNLEQMQDNISYMKEFKPLSQKEFEVAMRAEKILSKIESIPCTSCGYCIKDCPKNIPIFGTFNAYNIYKVYDNVEGAKGSYSWVTRDGIKASDCIECGECNKACPQHIDVVEQLKNAVVVLEQ